MARKAPEKNKDNTAPETVETPSVSSNVVLVANQHTGAIIFPRKGDGNVVVNPLIIPAGTVVPVDSIEWALRKQNPVVQYYMDARLLVEVNNVGPVPVLSNTSSDLDAIIPDMLQEQSFTGESTGVKSKPVEMQDAGTIEIK